MTETQDILRKIAVLRARLDQAHGILQASESEKPRGLDPEDDAVATLEAQVRKGSREAMLLDTALRPLSDDDKTLPPRLTARAMRLLHQSRDLLQTLRTLAEDASIRDAEDGPRSRLHKESAAMLESVLRTIQAFPRAPSAQLRLCEGLESVVEVVQERVKVLDVACTNHRQRQGRIDHLAGMFHKLATGQAIRTRDWNNLTDQLWEEARLNHPLFFYRAGADDACRFVAAHGLNVAQVLARVIQQEPEWQGHLHDCLLAGLVHDIGMIHLSGDLLGHPASWDDNQRRQMEKHTTLGAQMLAKVFAPGSLVVEAAQDHHERLDGSGYPMGKRDLQVSSFTRLLAVCDVYAALCCGRPHRPVNDTRTALTDTLMMADKGVLDRFQAEKLLRLSFYPPGSVVELADGAVGIVVNVHKGEQGLINPSKPILLLITESQGQPLAMPRLLDLLEDNDRSILRTLPTEARSSLLGRHFPELV